MTKADTYLYHDIHNILDHGYKDVDPRPKYADGTPAHTISVNQVFRKYDISRGEFPLLTLRPIAIKTGIREIFAIYQKGTHILADMRDMGIGWWDDWDIGDGTIGHRYGYTVSEYDLMRNLLNDIKKDVIKALNKTDFVVSNDDKELYETFKKTLGDFDYKIVKYRQNEQNIINDYSN